MARDTSDTTAPVASQAAESELIFQIYCAKNALAVNLKSSDELDVSTCCQGIQCS